MDIFDANMMCNTCEEQTQKRTLRREGFILRCWTCSSCKKQWIHPLDLQEYKEFQELKKKRFEVKLREVGNSWIVSIPRDIIRFQEITTKRLVCLSMNEPDKIIITFAQVRKIY